MSELSVEHLEVHYGDLVGVADVSLDVKPGAIVALLGSNGAGKTTTLNCIAGLVRPSGGSITWRGAKIGGEPAYAIVARGLALSPEGWQLFVTQTVEQNLRLGATVLDDKGKIAALYDRVYVLFPRLAERRKQLAGTLSGGEQQMCAIGRALMSKPKILLMDEPSAGLAPLVVAQVFELVQRIRAEGLTVLIVEQNVQQVLDVVDRAYLLEVGAIKLAGTAAELRNNDFIRKSYMGL